MQRPTRIVVFGILCLMVGAFSCLSNFGELSSAISGTTGAQPEQTAGMPEFMKQMEDMAKAMDKALQKPAYRVLIGIESSLGALMAGVLFAGGIGLLRDRRWGLKLARAWAFFAICSAVYTVILQTKFVMPEMSSAMGGNMIVASAGCSLPFLWLFPVLVLTLLSRPIVTDYLNNAGQPSDRSAAAGQPYAAATYDVGQPDAHGEPGTNLTPETKSGPDSTTKSASETWRDDPWNDPNSR